MINLLVGTLATFCMLHSCHQLCATGSTCACTVHFASVDSTQTLRQQCPLVVDTSCDEQHTCRTLCQPCTSSSSCWRTHNSQLSHSVCCAAQRRRVPIPGSVLRQRPLFTQCFTRTSVRVIEPTYGMGLTAVHSCVLLGVGEHAQKCLHGTSAVFVLAVVCRVLVPVHMRKT